MVNHVFRSQEDKTCFLCKIHDIGRYAVGQRWYKGAAFDARIQITGDADESPLYRDLMLQSKGEFVVEKGNQKGLKKKVVVAGTFAPMSGRWRGDQLIPDFLLRDPAYVGDFICNKR